VQTNRIAPWTVAVQLFFPFHHVSLAPVSLDEPGDAVAAPAGALGAFDAEQVEFSFDVSEDEIGTPRHDDDSIKKAPTVSWGFKCHLLEGNIRPAEQVGQS